MQTYPIKVPPLNFGARVFTDSQDIQGNVEKIQVHFDISKFSLVKELFISKYGMPHNQSIEKVRTKGGQELDSQVLNWKGDAVSIDIESLVNRDFIAGKLYESGLVEVSTNRYKDKIKAVIKESASGL